VGELRAKSEQFVVSPVGVAHMKGEASRVRIAPGSPFHFAHLAGWLLRALRIESPNQTEPTCIVPSWQRGSGRSMPSGHGQAGLRRGSQAKSLTQRLVPVPWACHNLAKYRKCEPTGSRPPKSSTTGWSSSSLLCPSQPQAILPAGEPLEKSMARSKSKQKIKHRKNKQRTKRRRRSRLAAKKSS
jgi:hypothetical protein